MKNGNVMKGMIAGGLLLVWAIPGTWGFLSDFDEKVNVITVGNITTEIQEDFPVPTPVDIEENPSFKKEVWVSCSDTPFQADCYVRLSLAYSDHAVGQAVVLENLDEENWVYDSDDGFYYYKKAMKAGERTSSLFTGVHIDSDRLGAYDPEKLKTFEISVYQEAMEAGKFADYRAAWNYYDAAAGS